MGIVLQGTVATATNMKLLVVLALVGLVYGDAKPQWLLPGLVTTKTAQVGETPASTYTATYGPGYLPLTYSHPLTYTHGLYSPYSFPFSSYPLLTVAKPAEEAAVESARKKRSADPEAAPEAEPEADPQLLISSGLHYPAAVTTYASPATYTLPTTYSLPATYSHGVYPYSGLYSGLHPYSGLFSYPGLGYPFLAAAKPAEEDAAVESARKKRSAEPEAEPEADPQLLLAGLHTAYTGLPTTALTGLPYTGLPYTGLPYTGLTYSTAYHPYSYTYPLGTTYHHAGLPLVSTAAVATE